MPPFKNGTKISYPHGRRRKDGKERKQKYHRVTAGPQRGQYVHDLIIDAVLVATRGYPMEKDETVEHRDGNGLNIGLHADGEPNLIVVSRSFNVRLRDIRNRKARARERQEELLKNGNGSDYADMPWANQF